MRAPSVVRIRTAVALLVLVVPALCLGDVVSNVGPAPSSKPVDPFVAELFGTSRTLPVYEDKEWVGIEVSHIAPSSPWTQLGVKDGDVLVAVGDLSFGPPNGLIVLEGAMDWIAKHREDVEAVRLSERRVALRLRSGP